MRAPFTLPAVLQSAVSIAQWLASRHTPVADWERVNTPVVRAGPSGVVAQPGCRECNAIAANESSLEGASPRDGKALQLRLWEVLRPSIAKCELVLVNQVEDHQGLGLAEEDAPRGRAELLCVNNP